MLLNTRGRGQKLGELKTNMIHQRLCGLPQFEIEASRKWPISTHL